MDEEDEQELLDLLDSLERDQLGDLDDDDDEEDLESVMAPARRKPIDEDEALAEAAWGHFTYDEAERMAGRLGEAGEVDAMGRAAGLDGGDGKPVVGGEALEHRDDSRAELDPGTTEDRAERHK